MLETFACNTFMSLTLTRVEDILDFFQFCVTDETVVYLVGWMKDLSQVAMFSHC